MVILQRDVVSALFSQPASTTTRSVRRRAEAIGTLANGDRTDTLYEICIDTIQYDHVLPLMLRKDMEFCDPRYGVGMQ
jgi:hypothetical protein